MESPQRRLRILVIQTAFPGDIVLTTPFLRGLRALFPQAAITLLTTPAGAELLANNPWQVEIKIYAKRQQEKGFTAFWRLGKKLQQEKYDFVFCLHRSLRSGILAWRTRAPVRIGFAGSPAAYFLTKKFSPTPGILEAEKNLALLQAISGRKVEENIQPELHWSAQDERVMQTLLGQQNKFVVIAPCSVWATKRWPPEKFAALIDFFWKKYGWQSLLVGAPSGIDQAVCLAVTDALPAEFPATAVKNLCGATTFPQLAYLASRAEFVVANDSAPLHIAVAAGAKGVAIFGPTTESLGFFPHAPQTKWRVAQVHGLACRPCGKHGHQQCPLGHFRCMKELTSSQVEAEIKHLCP